jgi:hypothetical protein
MENKMTLETMDGENRITIGDTIYRCQGRDVCDVEGFPVSIQTKIFLRLMVRCFLKLRASVVGSVLLPILFYSC